MSTIGDWRRVRMVQTRRTNSSTGLRAGKVGVSDLGTVVRILCWLGGFRGDNC
jgi:hypothetical protein